MARFRYQGTTEAGNRTRGVTRATSLKTAMAGLVEQGFTVSQLKPKRSVLKFEITKEKLPQGELMHFSRQLSAFVRAGIPLIEALDVINEEADDKTLRMVLQGVRESLVTGETFSEALRPYETLFPKFYVDMVRAAELTGSLDDVLRELSGYIRRDLEARNKIKSALVYPMIILLMAIGTVIVLSTFVLPRFKAFFEGFHATLPLPTRMLLSFANFVSGDWLYIIAGLVLLIAIPMAFVRTPTGRRAKDRLLLRIPVVGSVILFAIIERFCRLLATMMRAGVPLPEAMGVLGDSTKNVIFKNGLDDVHAAMMRG
ncbi:MAG: type II secretion system F family protein, partial [Actinobacteria bacterium]